MGDPESVGDNKTEKPHQEWMFRMMEMTRDRLNDSQIEWLDKRPFSMTYPDLGHDFHVFLERLRHWRFRRLPIPPDGR